MKKLFTLFLALVASVGAIYAQSGSCGDNLTWTYSPGTLTISGTGAMADYSSYTDVPWYDYHSSIKSVIINDGVTSIGRSAFKNCSSLTSITIPNSVTSIGYGAFWYCKSLTSVTIGNSVTSIGEQAFENCSSLISITIPNSVTSIGDRAFYDCTSLTSVTIGNSVTSIGYGAFENCSSLTSITIPNSVTSIENRAFSGCSSLTSINVDSNNPNYSSVDGVLFNKDKTTLVAYPGGKQGAYTIPNSVTSIGYGAFSGCSSLSSVTIPNSVTSIGEGAFSGCSSLSSVTIPNSVTSIGDYAFSGCSKLTSPVYNAHCFAYMPISYSGAYAIPEGIKQIAGSAFSGCSSLSSVTIPNSVTSIGDYAFYKCSSLTSITIPNSVTSIGDYAFEYCSKLTSVHITDLAAWCNIDFENYANPLYYAHKLYLNGELVKDLVIPNSVTSIGDYAFHGCSSLSSVTIPNSVTSIGVHAFLDCSSLTSVHITDLAAWCNIDFGVYTANPLYYAYKLYLNGELVKDLVIPNSVTSIGSYAFYGCSSLTSITIPNSVTSIGSGAFYDCESLTSVTIPNSVTSIENRAFWGCESLTSVTIGNSVTSIGYGAFWYCKSLTSVTIGNSVTSIGEQAFENCSSLTSITIPNSVTSMGYSAFGGCSSLSSVTNYATQPQAIGEFVFRDVDLSPCQLYVPSTSVGLYKTAKVWKDFGNIQPIRAEDITDVSETIITPSENEVEITWPSVTGAATYELVIKDKDGNIVCTLIFNANGQLTSIAFNAPSRNGVPAQTQSAGFSFTITGLDSGTGYDLTLTAKDNSGNIIEETTIPFHTDYPEGIEDIPSSSLQGGDRGRLILRDGQVLILRNGKTYTMQGQEVK